MACQLQSSTCSQLLTVHPPRCALCACIPPDLYQLLMFQQVKKPCCFLCYCIFAIMGVNALQLGFLPEFYKKCWGCLSWLLNQMNLTFTCSTKVMRLCEVSGFLSIFHHCTESTLGWKKTGLLWLTCSRAGWKDWWTGIFSSYLLPLLCWWTPGTNHSHNHHHYDSNHPNGDNDDDKKVAVLLGCYTSMRRMHLPNGGFWKNIKSPERLQTAIT